MITKNKDFPKYLPYAEVIGEITAYNKAATVEAEVTISEVHYNEGRQWAHEGDTVKLSPADAKVLERAGQIRVISTKG